jgi:hypothetical protein
LFPKGRSRERPFFFARESRVLTVIDWQGAVVPAVKGKEHAVTGVDLAAAKQKNAGGVSPADKIESKYESEFVASVRQKLDLGSSCLLAGNFQPRICSHGK